MKQRQKFAKVAMIAIPLLLVGCSSSSATDTSAAAPTSVVPTTSAVTSIPATTAAPASTLSPTAGLPTGVAGDLPNGVYRVETTDADLEAVNVPADTWTENHGTYTWTLKDGSWSFLQTASNPIQNPTADGVYVVDGNNVTFLTANDYGPQEFTWAVNSAGSLVLSALPSTDNLFAAILAAHPLVLAP